MIYFLNCNLKSYLHAKVLRYLASIRAPSLRRIERFPKVVTKMFTHKRFHLSINREKAIDATVENNGNKSIKAESSHTPQLQQTKSLFVHSLPESATSESLITLFSQLYPLKHATVVLDPITKISKGYGFVTFADYEDARRAQQTFDGALFEGRKIKVKAAEPRRRDLILREIAHEKRSRSPTLITDLEPERPLLNPKGLQPPKLIVRNLPWSISEPDQLAALFSSYGKVKHTTIPKKKPGISAGFGFVTLRGRKNAENAMKSLNGKMVGGRILAVDWAVDKQIWETLRKDEEIENSELQAQEKAKASSSTTIEVLDDGVNSLGPGQEITNDADATKSGSKRSWSQFESGTSHGSPLETGNSNNSTLFVRNIPFDITDEMLQDRFAEFGSIRYARVVFDPITDNSKGVGFVCFYCQEDANACLRRAPGAPSGQPQRNIKPKRMDSLVKPSLLEDLNTDPSGCYTLQGRVLQVSLAVDRSEAERLKTTGKLIRDSRDNDKRRLYLLSEGTISAESPLHGQLALKEIKLREDSAKHRQTLVKRNPLLHLSLTRLSVRNLPRNITSKDLKALARKAVVGFARDVKARIRKPLSKEEVLRGGDGQIEAEKARKAKGKGIVKQAKVVFEAREGRKVSEDSGAGRSSGYGFIEYTSHRWALMGLRWLNGHAARDLQGASKEDTREKKSRLVVEFAIENSQIVGRRFERERKSLKRSTVASKKREGGEIVPVPQKK